MVDELPLDQGPAPLSGNEAIDDGVAGGESEYPWRDLGRVWWGALVSGGRTYGLIRRTPRQDGVRYEYLERRVWRNLVDRPDD